jgi:RNA polymerase sigma-70 factor, ECF subfamily
MVDSMDATFRPAKHIPPQTTDQDEEAIAACQQGDVEAFEVLVLRYQKRMFNIAFRIIGNREDAGEVVQDAFVSAYKNIKTFRGSSKFTTWLTKIVMNLSRNRIKKLHAEKCRGTVSLDDCLETGEGRMKINPDSGDPSAHLRMERKQIQLQVQWCINKIDTGFREVLVLKDIQGFAYTEIGEILKIPQGTVKSKLYRARDSLKNCLKRVIGDLQHVLP